MIDQKELNKARELRQQGYSTKEISEMMNKSQRTIQRYVAAVNILEVLEEDDDSETPEIESNQEFDLEGALWILPDKEKPKNRIMGCIGDLHLPVMKKGYIEFLIDTFKKWNVTDIMFMGDCVDMSTLSHHVPEADAPSVPEEFSQAQKTLDILYKVFPTAKCCKGNHTARLEKRASDSGIPAFCIKSLRELFKIPKTWDIQDVFEINGVTYTHGTQFNSRNILTTAANFTSGSLVIGHQHSLLGVVYNTNMFGRESFAMACGCGVDETAYAFRYGKNNKMKSVLGCGIVVSSREAYAIKWEV